MRNRFACIVGLLMLATSMFALEKHSPWQVGVRTGVVISDMVYTSSTYDAYKYQFYGRGNIGLWVQREWSGFALRPEVDITGRGTVRKTDDVYYALKPRYVDIRLSLIYTFLRDKIVQPYIFLTPNFNIALNGNLSYRDQFVDLSRAMTKADITPYNFSTMLGVGMRFPMILNRQPFYISVDAGYNFGCIDTYTKEERNGEITHIGSDVAAEGHRFSSNVEIAMSVGVPFSSFKKHTPTNSHTNNGRRGYYSSSSAKVAAVGKSLIDYKEPATQPTEQSWTDQLASDPDKLAEQMTRKMNSYNYNLPAEDRVGNDVRMSVKPSMETIQLADGIEQRDIHLLFAYETLPSSSKTGATADDYPLGNYLASSSKACMATLNYLREQLSSDEIAAYLNAGRRVTIIITGETDGTPIHGKIPYNGEYGSLINQACLLNNASKQISVTPQSGITTNAQLGLMRAQGVRYFLSNYIEPLRLTINDFQYQIVERQEKGAQYRRIAIEIVIHNVME